MSEVARMFIGEFLGTMVLILLGDGVVAAVLLNKSKAENSGWIVITAGWAFAVTCGVLTSLAFGGIGSLNPAGLIAGYVCGARFKIDAVTAMVVAEFLGAFVGATLVWIHYGPHWVATTDSKRKLAVFCTGPAIRSPMANLASEIIGTFALVFIAGSIGKAMANSPALQPSLIGMLVWAIGLSLGGTTGYAINPARDLGPRLAHFLLPIPEKGDSDWSYAWIPVVGPVLGATAGAALILALDTFASSYS